MANQNPANFANDREKASRAGAQSHSESKQTMQRATHQQPSHGQGRVMNPEQDGRLKDNR